MRKIFHLQIKSEGSHKYYGSLSAKTESGKYRTLPFSKKEFEHADSFWTGNDWQNFLKTDEYYKI